ncbi:hypothetical protein chiPu_0030293, partial [Chiloscyllium punctatum]|nr:hypothetical protein [Chiloscyllium punctatum]
EGATEKSSAHPWDGAPRNGSGKHVRPGRLSHPAGLHRGPGALCRPVTPVRPARLAQEGQEAVGAR